jgi:TolB-like protein/Tfp pilus assembly protein PilF
VKESSPSRHLFRFGVFEADLAARELRKNGVKLRLQDQPFCVLALLLEHPGQAVTREELRQRLWSADTFVDFDNGLNTAINKIREALGDSAENPRFVETLPRRGYRFLESSAGMAPETSASIAVLPFLNLSADPDNEFFADGMSEEIISALTQIKTLQVAARTSSFSFKGKHVDLREIGEQLNVRTVLEGSVRRAGNHLRITAQLVNVSDGYHLWSEKYDREMKDIFEVQDEIARSIAQRLEVTLEGGQQPLVKAGTDNIEAFKFYTQGRASSFQRGPRLPDSLKCFKKAATLDPKYAIAWSGLADAYNTHGFYGLLKPEECLPQAKEAAECAIALNPSLSDGHNSLAQSHLLHDWDRLKAEREYLLALELNPRCLQARYWYAMFYLHFAAGRFEEGLAQAIRVVESDPLAGWTRAMLACMYVTAGNLDEAIIAAQTALQYEPDSFTARWAIFTALNTAGRYAEAAAFGESILAVSGRHPWLIGSLALTYAELGRRSDARATVMELQWRAKREYVSPGVLAWTASGAGDQDSAILYAHEAHKIGDPVLIAAKYWPTFARLRKDPRFNEILFNRGWS